jgi:hypothetical protein
VPGEFERPPASHVRQSRAPIEGAHRPALL